MQWLYFISLYHDHHDNDHDHHDKHRCHHHHHHHHHHFCVYCACRHVSKVSNVRIGSGRASIGTTLIAELYTKCGRTKWRLLWGLFFENSPFLREFMRYLMQTTPQRRQGRGSSGPESLFEVNRRSRKSKSRRSSKAKRRVKSPQIPARWTQIGTFFASI